MGEELSGLVDDGNLAAGAEAGVDAQDGDRAGGRGEQEVLEVIAKDLDGVGVGALFELEAQLALDGRAEQALPGVVDGELEVRRPVPGWRRMRVRRSEVARSGSISMRK